MVVEERLREAADVLEAVAEIGQGDGTERAQASLLRAIAAEREMEKSAGYAYAFAVALADTILGDSDE